MSRRAAFKQADLTRALKGAQAAGLKPSGFHIDPHTGKIEVNLGNEAASSTNSFDALIGTR